MLFSKENLQSVKEAMLCMDIFPSSNNFMITSQTLKKRYHELAFRLHPDKKGAKEDFLNLKKSYDILIKALDTNPQIFSVFNSKREPKKEDLQSIKKPVSDAVYLLYKRASIIYSEALEDYFEKVKQVNLSVSDENYQSLLTKLVQCKSLLAKIIKKDPAGIWTSDAIEKVASINVWIKNSNK
ncbi:MAG: J domain-containing protein [Spirochaetia bacterium]|nr:J domain-containing protein [Spirochaetia bacterium]